MQPKKLWAKNDKLLFSVLGGRRPQSLPLGEAVATIGASEPIVVTDEGLNCTESSDNAGQIGARRSLIRHGLRRATFPQGKALAV